MKSTADGSFRNPGDGSEKEPARKPRRGEQAGSLWIWPFELTEKLGEGGMAVVYRGRFVKNDTYHAVKMLPEDLVANETALARFKREMEVLKTLRHPNVVRCFGGTAENGQPFYAMELIEGGTLDDQLRKLGKRPWRTTAECGLQMCAALECAHEAGIVHRDVKPSNFLVDGDTLKLSDFGLALIASSAKITAADKTVGTFDYMAPEQITGSEVTPLTDVYALGCVFFEMLTGRPPFVSEERVAILHQHLRTQPPPVTEFAADCPPDFERLVDDMLEKDPARRPPDVHTVAVRLQAILDGKAVGLGAKARAPSPIAPESPTKPAARSPQLVPTITAGERRASGHLPWVVGALALLCSVLLLRNFVLADALAARAPALDLILAEAIDEEGSWDARRSAIEELGQLGSRSEAVVDALMSILLEDPDPRVRAAAAESLGEVGAQSRKHSATILNVQRDDEEPSVRIACEGALRKIREAPSPGNPWWWRGLLVFVFLGGVVAVVRLPGRARATTPTPAPAPKRPSPGGAALPERWRARRK